MGFMTLFPPKLSVMIVFKLTDEKPVILILLFFVSFLRIKSSDTALRLVAVKSWGVLTFI